MGFPSLSPSTCLWSVCFQLYVRTSLGPIKRRALCMPHDVSPEIYLINNSPAYCELNSCRSNMGRPCGYERIRHLFLPTSYTVWQKEAVKLIEVSSVTQKGIWTNCEDKTQNIVHRFVFVLFEQLRSRWRLALILKSKEFIRFLYRKNMQHKGNCTHSPKKRWDSQECVEWGRRRYSDQPVFPPDSREPRICCVLRVRLVHERWPFLTRALTFVSPEKERTKNCVISWLLGTISWMVVSIG